MKANTVVTAHAATNAERGQAAAQVAPLELVDQAAEDQVTRIGEQKAEDERQVAQGERVGTAPELHVDDAALGDDERDRERPPGQISVAHERVEVVDRPGV